MLEKGKLVPNWTVTDEEGRPHGLWDYRQKSHVILLYDPQADAAARAGWHQEIKTNNKQWDWLKVIFVMVAQAPETLPPGVYVIDRYGRLWNFYPPKEWTFEGLEKDLVYYEARHC
jgi:hypothetical protein